MMNNPERRELTREVLVWLNDNAHRTVQVHTGGQVIEDVDGVPLAVTPNVTEDAVLTKPVISLSEAERLGVDPKEFPNVRFV